MGSLVEQLELDVEALCPAGGRFIGTPEHDRAREYIVQRLTESGVAPYQGSFEHPYRCENETMVNIAGVIPAEAPDGRPVLIGAHYDSVIPSPCADDNAAAVAITLAAAEALLKTELRRDVIVAVFDAEEPPHFLGESMGSVRFYEDHLAAHGVEAAIIMDLVGHDVLVRDVYVKGLGPLERLAGLLPKQNGHDIAFPRLKDMLFVMGAESHQGLPEILDRTKLPRGLRMIPTLNRYIGDMSDHAVFRSHGVPYLFLSCGRWPYYHTEADTPEKLNYRKMARIATYVVRIVNELSNASLPHSVATRDGEAEAATVDFEIRHFKKACGLLHPVVLKYLGVNRFSTREDINRLVHNLMSFGL